MYMKYTTFHLMIASMHCYMFDAYMHVQRLHELLKLVH